MGMALCLHLYRRGGIYWWRRRLASEHGSCYVHVGLRLRGPHRTRQLARKLDVEADRVTELVRKGMLRRRTAQDRTAAVQSFCSNRRQRRRAFVDDSVRAGLKSEGYSDDDILEIGALTAEFAPAVSTFEKNAPADSWRIGPPYEYFVQVLAEMGIAESATAVNHARRLWMTAQSTVSADVDRRYALVGNDASDVYRQLADEGAVSPANDAAPVLPTVAAKPAGSVVGASEEKISILAAVETLIDNKIGGQIKEWQVQPVGSKMVCERTNTGPWANSWSK
jgi:hypothetical protein